MARWQHFIVCSLDWLLGWTIGYAVAASAQVTVFHATGRLPSYEVATIKKADGGNGVTTTNMGRAVMISGQTVKNYIQTAYGIQRNSGARVLEGPAWINTDMYVIQGKMPDAMRDAMQTMTPEARQDQNRMLQQSLLAERFKLKVHFEMREMPVFELAAAKGGLKIKAVPPPPAYVPGTPLPPPPRPGGPLAPGMLMMQLKDGKTVMNASATTMNTLMNLLANATEIAGRPVIDKTGFTGNFDVTDLQWAGSLTIVSGPAQPAPVDVDAGSDLYLALQESLGLKLTPGKAQVEVIVIDSIERPSEN